MGNSCTKPNINPSQSAKALPRGAHSKLTLASKSCQQLQEASSSTLKYSHSTKYLPEISQSRLGNNQSSSKMLRDTPTRPQYRISIVKMLSDNNKQSQELSLETKQTAKTQNEKLKSLDEYQRIGVLGSGAFGTVYLVKTHQQAQASRLAMKRIDKRLLINPYLLQNLRLEKLIMTVVDSPFVVKLRDSFQDEAACYLVMEFAEGGDIFSILSKTENPAKRAMFLKKGEEAVRFVMACVILGMEALHKKGILYRDLKPENVLLFENGYAKLADFGLAKRVGQVQKGNIAGTRIYFAPQVVEDKRYSLQTELWCLGVFLHELVYGKPPFEACSIAKGSFREIASEAEIYRKKLSKDSDKVSEQARDLIDRFLRVDEKLRIGRRGMAQIKQHDFFINFDWKTLERGEMESPMLDLVRKFPCHVSLQASSRKPTAPKEAGRIIVGFRQINALGEDSQRTLQY